MRIHPQRPAWCRRAIVAMMFGVMLPVLIGLAALSVDVGVIATARAQLSTAADAAALAGAMQLADENRIRGFTDLSSEISAANDQAATFAQDNLVLYQTPVIVKDPNNNGTGDIRVGYINPDPAVPKLPLETSSLFTTRFNSVQVTSQRSSTHGGQVPTFFGRIFGIDHFSDVAVQSTATAQNFAIAGFKSVNNRNANLLPIVLDNGTYTKMISGTPNTATDQYTYNPTTKTVTPGPDNIMESQLYPVGSGSPGNWGTVNIGVSNNSTNTLGEQIRNGITPTQLANFPNSTIQLDTGLTPPSITFSGNPGISGGIEDDLKSIMGKPVMIPVYDTNGGNGNNAWYRVVKFAGVRILDVNFQGNPKYVIVQPALVNDPTAIAGAALTSWTAGGLLVVYLSR